MPAADSSSNGDAPLRRFSRTPALAEVAVGTGPGAPGAARMAVADCLAGLLPHRIVLDAELLVSELVTNSIEHGELSSGDTVLVRVFLAADMLRFEIENPGTAGVVVVSPAGRESGGGGYGLELVDLLAARWGVSRNHSTNVWFEIERA